MKQSGVQAGDDRAGESFCNGMGLRGMRAAQGTRQGVRRDVSGSELPGSRAQSAVFLIHAESLRQASQRMNAG